MSLSFELGMPLHEVRKLPQSDLHQYLLYAERHGLPRARIELLLAQLPQVMAEVQGIKGTKVSDFMRIVQPPPDEIPQDIDPEQAAEEVAAALGFKPRRRKPDQQETQNNDGK